VTPAHLSRLVLAELRAVFGRWSGRAALVLAVAVPILASLAMRLFLEQADEAVVNGLPARSLVDMSWRGVLDWSLTGRNFFVLPLLLVLGTASSFTGEIADNTLREAMLRPVPRWSLLTAKLVALSLLSLATLALTWLLGAAGGLAVAGGDASIGGISLAFLACWVCDMGLICLTLLVASLLRTVGLVVVGVALLLILDWAGGMLLSLIGSFGQEWATTANKFRPGFGLNAWDGWNQAAGYDGQQWLTLGIVLVVGFGGALMRFERMDVP
jgi:ABC-type transport system involved in multi-copper enzyme maturation permease subunit